MKLKVSFSPQELKVSFKESKLKCKIDPQVVREYVERPAYEGETVVTPTSETQILSTKNLRMTDNITINPIPSNYGLITWDGSIITVS